MEAILIVGATKDGDTLDKLYTVAVETHNFHRGHKNVWIVLDGVAVRIFNGDDLKIVSEIYGNIVSEIKKR